jgi:hypothetical protein
MPQTVARFETPVSDRSGRLYDAKACGREREDGLWEGWIEFENRATHEVLRTQRETTQPNLTDLTYWASGLTTVYLEGALERTLNPTQVRPPEYVPPPVFDGPAKPAPRERRPSGDAILDPFSVYEKSPRLLAQELTALRGWHLRQIIRDYNLARGNDALENLTEAELGSLILDRVRELQN